MSRSLSLAAYRALSRRKQVPASDTPPARPKGELVWFHATDPVRFSALNDLGRRLKVMRPGLRVLLTHDAGGTPDAAGPVPEGCDWILALSSDHPTAARKFLDHWKPDICLWTGGALLVNLVNAASESGVPMILADVGGSDYQTGRRKWFPDPTRASLDLFDTILVNSAGAERAVLRNGIAPAKVLVTPRLRSSAAPPPCRDSDLTEVTGELAGRPAWLAVGILPDEVEPVLAAHRAALRLAHRLLLIAMPADPTGAALMKEKLAGTRLRVADWDNGEVIEDGVQVLLSANAEDLGLWYRVAPLTFLAGSLSPEGGGWSPLEAAALGSAILYGPNVGRHIDTYSRLAAAGAARTVSDGESLGAALVQLVAPDHAAAMALAGWEVATEGAELTDRLLDMVQDRLDQAERSHARS